MVQIELHSPRQSPPRLNTGENMLRYIFVNGVAGVAAIREKPPEIIPYDVRGYHGRFVKKQ